MGSRGRGLAFFRTIKSCRSKYCAANFVADRKSPGCFSNPVTNSARTPRCTRRRILRAGEGLAFRARLNRVDRRKPSPPRSSQIEKPKTSLNPATSRARVALYAPTNARQVRRSVPGALGAPGTAAVSVRAGVDSGAGARAVIGYRLTAPQASLHARRRNHPVKLNRSTRLASTSCSASRLMKQTSVPPRGSTSTCPPAES